MSDPIAKRLYDIEYRKRPAVRRAVKARLNAAYLDPYGRAKKLCGTAKMRAYRSGREFSITVEHVHCVIAMGVCQKSGLPFDLTNRSHGAINPFAPSIDRIDNAKGYTSDNIQIVCSMFNMGKHEHREVDFIAMCVAVAERFANDPAVCARLKELRGA